MSNNNGWICPRCNNVYAPINLECKSCNMQKKQSIPNNIHTNWCWQCNKFIEIPHVWESSQTLSTPFCHTTIT